MPWRNAHHCLHHQLSCSRHNHQLLEADVCCGEAARHECFNRSHPNGGQDEGGVFLLKMDLERKIYRCSEIDFF